MISRIKTVQVSPFSHHMFKQLICILTVSRLSPSHHHDMNEKVKALSDPRAIQYLVLSYFFEFV